MKINGLRATRPREVPDDANSRISGSVAMEAGHASLDVGNGILPLTCGLIGRAVPKGIERDKHRPVQVPPAGARSARRAFGQRVARRLKFTVLHRA